MENIYKILPDVLIHPTALVETSNIGSGTKIWAFSHILPGAAVGNDCNICDHTFIEGGVKLGSRVTVKSGVYLWSGITCEDDVFLGPNVTFTNDFYPRSRREPSLRPLTLIGRGASLGANASILGGVKIGEYALVGMGSVVTRDVPPFGLVYGNPARLKGFVSHYGEKLIIEGNLGTCPQSQLTYRIEGKICTPLSGEENISIYLKRFDEVGK